jgi:hypothetical protein
LVEPSIAAITKPLAHYKLGDLGIVPRPKPKLGERLGTTSPTLEPIKKMRSIGVQTISAQKVRLYAEQLHVYM